MGQVRPGRVSRGQGGRRLQRRVSISRETKIIAPGRDHRPGVSISVSSLRTQGPITTGIRYCESRRTASFKIKDTEYGSLRSQGRQLSLAAERPLRVHIERVDRLARGHEQAVALDAAETKIGAALGQRDAPDHDAVWRVDDDAVEFGIAHAPAAPQIAVDVAAHAVGGAGAGVDEDALVGDLVA